LDLDLQGIRVLAVDDDDHIHHAGARQRARQGAEVNLVQANELALVAGTAAPPMLAVTLASALRPRIPEPNSDK